jgi:hypothetical protein
MRMRMCICINLFVIGNFVSLQLDVYGYDFDN